MRTDSSFAYGGLYPDGSLLMSSTTYLGSFTAASSLYDTKTGAKIAAPGWDGTITQGGTTAFSPDGKHLTFVHEDKDMGHSIALMDFDIGQKQFSNLVDIATDPITTWPGQPSPRTGNRSCITRGRAARSPAGLNSTADLFIVDIATKTAQRLDALDGYTGSGSGTYLPANDSGAERYSDGVAGGRRRLLLVVFTSHRSYGNILASKASSDTLGKLWIAAVDIDPTPGMDPSHPAFYLDGQELNADNLRGFLTLPPCEAAGASCTSGDQCCGGYCGQVSGGFQCTSKPPPCSNELDKCTTSAECCDTADLCINNRCSQPPPPK